MRIRDLFSKIRDLFSKFETYSVIRDYETKKTAGAAEPPSLAPMHIYVAHEKKIINNLPIKELCAFSSRHSSSLHFHNF